MGQAGFGHCGGPAFTFADHIGRRAARTSKHLALPLPPSPPAIIFRETAAPETSMKSQSSDTVLDAIDRRILSELQADGRMTNVELARRAGISAPPCLRRVRRLEEAGIIRGYHADTDPQKLDWEIVFFAIVGLDSQKETVLAGFEALVATWPEVRECHMIRGGGDFLLRLVARDTAHENQLTQRLTGAATVSRVQTLQTIRTSRHLTGVPL
jgi:DNA-binding Lrp family transcriptional regulator